MSTTFAAAGSALHYVTLDVFTSSRYLGNPLAIVYVPRGQDVQTKHMQRIAREFNYSETVFLYDVDHQDDGSSARRYRIFTTAAELPFAGHPTIGTACHVLDTLRSTSSPKNDIDLLCNAGEVHITQSTSSTSAQAQIPMEFHQHEAAAVSIEEVLRIQPALQAELIVSVDLVSPVKGMNFVVVELRDVGALGRVSITGVGPRPRLDAGWEHGFLGTAYYVKTGESDDKHQYRTRMIETSFEDPATGSMSCGLATLLADRASSGKTDSIRFEFTQGVEMGRQSDIVVTVSGNSRSKDSLIVVLEGSAVQVMEGTITL